MATETKYKQTQRLVRTTLREPAYINGMHYTDTPIGSGFGRVLINLENNFDDTGLRPRKGARVKGLYAGSPDKTSTVQHLYFADTLSKFNGTVMSPAVRYVIDNKLYYAWQQTQETIGTPQSLIVDSFVPIRVNDRLVSCTGFETNDLLYTASDGSQFALLKAEAKTEESTLGNISKVVPRLLNPTEAANWGFNMLLTEPYAFQSTDGTPNQVIFQGLLPYDSEGLVLNPVCNNTVPYTFKLITQTGDGTYAVRMRWRGVTNDIWEDITPDTGTLTQDAAIAYDLNKDALKTYQIKFNPKQQATVIQVKIYVKKPDAKVLDKTYLDPKYKFQNGTKPSENPPENTIYPGDVEAQKIYKHNDTYGNTYYYEVKDDAWIYAYYPTSEDDAEETIFEQGYRALLTNAMSFNFVKSAEYSSVKAVKYDIASAKGMCYWRNRVVVWGVDKAPTTLFFSDINDPGYFPYPNNISLFSEPVLHALPFQNDLLVFTKSQLWRISLNNDGLSWTQVCIQKNLRLDENETQLTLALSTMVFFKSGPYYYLLVPSSKGTGELVLASISRNTEDVFKDPFGYMKRAVSLLYREEFENDKVNITYRYPSEFNTISSGQQYYAHTYLDYDKIHIVFSSEVLLDSTKQKFTAICNLVLSYDINTRAWTSWIFETPQVPRLIEQDSIKHGVWACLTRYSALYRLEENQNTYTRLTLPINDSESITYTASFENDPEGTPNNPGVISQLQTFIFESDNDCRDLLRRYVTQSDEEYLLGWAIYKGNTIDKNNLVAKTITPQDTDDSKMRYSVILLGTPAEYIDPNTGIKYINYTDKPRTFDKVYIPAAPAPFRFAESNGNNIFKNGEKNLIEDEFVRAIPEKQEFTVIRLTQANTYIWTYGLVKQGEIAYNTIKPGTIEERDAFFFKNYQYLDSGVRDITPELKKKFREYQLDINNLTDNRLSFYVEFLADKRVVQPIYEGNIDYRDVRYSNADESFSTSDSFKEAYVENTLENEVNVEGTVKELERGLLFELGATRWNRPFIAKLRAPLCSKGYLGNLKILSRNLTPYEILFITWVYRYQSTR